MRKRFKWKVVLAASDGQVVEQEVSNYWGPEHPDTSERIGEAAALKLWWEAKKSLNFAPTSVTLLK